MTPEQKSSEKVRLRASALGLRLMRNNSGVMLNQNGIPVRFGLGNESKKLNKKIKSSDLIGITPLKITPEMVGKTIGVFTATEVKSEKFKVKEEYSEKSRESAQLKFIDFVKSLGGMAGFCRNEQDVDNLVNNYVEGLKNE